MLCNLAVTDIFATLAHQEAWGEAAAPHSFSFDTPGAKDAADVETPDLTPQGALRSCTAGRHLVSLRLASVTTR